MINIKQITKKRGNNYSVILENNGKEETYLLPERTLFKHYIFTKKTLDKVEYNKFKKDSVIDVLFEKALHFISYQMRTISEVKKHLSKTTQDQKLIENVITELKTHNYINDKEFVKEFVRQKIEYDLVGPKYIKDKLVKKGIHFDLIDSELSHFTEAIQFDKIYQIIQKETAYPIKKPLVKAKLSIKQKLVSKGFSIRIIDSAMYSHANLIKEAISDQELLHKEFEKLKKKFDITSYEEKQKLIKSLLSKGYSYSKIKELF